MAIGQRGFRTAPTVASRMTWHQTTYGGALRNRKDFFTTVRVNGE